MSFVRSIRDALLPRRASTQTWMVLTFALFVGTAVVGVGLYVMLVLRGEMRTAMQETLHDQADRIAVQAEQEPGPAGRGRIVDNLTELQDLHVSLITPDTTYRPSPQTAPPFPADTLVEVSALRNMTEETVRFARHDPDDGQQFFLAALYRPSANLIVQVGQPPPPLYSLAQRSQVVLVLGMILALVLALIGSFIAAYQVTTPLTRISETARRVADGKLTGKIQVESRAAEFQDLAESLNRASDTFREKIEELERMTRLQSEFIGNVSHEVRNPIFSISGYLEALGTPGLDDEQRKMYSEKALTNLNRLQNLFNDLIDIARLEYKEDLINRSVFDLKDLVDEVAEMLRPKAEEKGLDLEADVSRFFVHADRSRVRQVLTNLIENGIAYTGGGSVRCRVQRRLDKVRVEIVDTGQGIDEDHLDRIFERFYRVDPDRSRESGGTGLGLSIVKQILQAHGEDIHVESTKGRGTRFWFELPYEPEPEAVEA
ncbi:sensor histidine kinase [Salinibacter ruber]|uniref:sensor histidine kinase n=1 Tax=Salinibacter ruber TaxID=146919 RepID=UPI002169D385|nr:HAMP domain-containing sensor histidine kinase [Salinibacter ruber]MCS4198051.1 signal transduction histidine kinase [Salinibacter ruber]